MHSKAPDKFVRVAFFLKIFLFTNLFNIDNLQILRYCKKLKSTIAYHNHIPNLRQRTRYIVHTLCIHYAYIMHTNIIHTNIKKNIHRYELNATKVLNKWPRKSTGTIS